ncbi:TetR/AcrR family transcriptional regulator [Streptomyces sp. NPDC007027]|uniref:TetR/AcrR family transcriptional regulator n=1 Tax=unclassified Streptomyces TaxID=2593676 RepID=UPI0033E35CAF
MPAPPAPLAPHGRTGRPPVTSRTRILSAARRLIDRDGWEKLTIRRLAAELGIGATTLYHYIQNKEDLLVLLLNHYIDQLERPDLPNDPPERILTAATAMHDALADWPWTAEILTADGFVGLLDESALWMVEAILSGAHDHGCTPEQTVEVFRSIWYYTVGEILVRAHSHNQQNNNDKHLPRETSLSNLDTTRVPHLAAIGNRWTALAAQNTYHQGLRALINGLLTPTPPPTTTQKPTNPH